MINNKKKPRRWCLTEFIGITIGTVLMVASITYLLVSAGAWVFERWVR